MSQFDEIKYQIINIFNILPFYYIYYLEIFIVLRVRNFQHAYFTVVKSIFKSEKDFISVSTALFTRL